MAPSTALLFVLCATALLLRLFIHQSPVAQWSATLIFSACGATALILFALSSMGIHPAVEHLGLTITGSVGQVPMGHMSPVTALCFVITALSFLASASFHHASSKRQTVAWWLAALLLAVNSVFLLAYLYGSPLLYGGKVIPPALTTITAFLATGIALLNISAPRHGSTHILNGTRKSASRLLVILFAILAGGILVSGHFYFRHFEEKYRLESEKTLSAIADLKVAELLLWRKERLGDGAVIHGNSAFSNLVGRHFQVPVDRKAETELRGWIGKLQAAYQYDSVFLLDPRNRVRISTRPAPETVDSSVAYYAARALLSGEVTFVDFHRHGNGNYIHLSLIVPIFDGAKGRRPLGVLIMTIDPGRYLYPFISRWPVPSRSAETLLVRREGDEVVYLNKLRFDKRDPLTLRLPLSHPDLPAAKAVLGREAVVEGPDYRGVQVVAALRRVPGSPWFLVAKMDATEIYAPLREKLWFVIALVAALLISAAAAVGLIWRQQSALFYKERFHGERERAWLQDLVSRSLNKIYVFDPDTLRITFANRAACENTGYREEELKGMTMPDIEPEFSDGTFRTMVGPLLSREKERLVLETTHRRKDGSTYPVEIFLQLVDTDKGPLSLAVVNDISERKAHELARLASEEKYRTLVETMTEGVALHEMIYNSSEPADYRLITVNPAYARHTGIAVEKAQGALASALYGTGAPPFLKEFEHVARTGEPMTFDTFFPPMKKHFHIAVNSPGPALFATVFEDITERKRQEEELREKNLELERLNYTVSHDLKSPLVTVKTFLGYLAQDMAKGDSARIEQDMMYMRTAADRMGSLLDDLFDLSRLGRTSYPPVDVEFRELAQEAVNLVAGRISQRGVRVALADARVVLHGDRPRLLQLWQNLIDNAAKFMGDQSTPRIEVGVESGGAKETVFFVKDNGQGIDPRHREKIFGLFEQLDQGVEGTGIGLALVKRIVEQYGGALWMESEGPGKGTAFFFTLPEAIKNS
jgi:PAS domain S-box-containing protein